MKRFAVFTLVTGLVFSRAVVAGDFPFDPACRFAPGFAPPCPTVLPCPTETPPICLPRPLTVRRVVPRTTYQTVTKTVMVPETVFETRQTQSVEYHDEIRERTSTVFDQVPETRAVTTQQTVLVPEVRMRTEAFTVEVPVVRQVPQTYTVNAIHTETRAGVQRVCQCIERTELRTVVTGGEIQKRSVDSPNGGVKVQTVVVGGCKTQQPVKVIRQQIVERPYSYQVQVNHPETRTRLVETTEYHSETRTRPISEVVQVPRIETRTQHVTEMRTVPRPVTQSYTERVPHTVTKDIQVPVTRMVARQVTEQIPVTTYDVIEEPILDCPPLPHW